MTSDTFIFTDPAGQPLSQEWLNKRIWLPTLQRAGIPARGQYNIRDTFITLALSAGEDPGWVAQVCGTSEQMIFGPLPKMDARACPPRWSTARDALSKPCCTPPCLRMGTGWAP
ncbi:MAG: hypothetical protein ABIR79_21550 [Candidatus Binatia bacterium]